MYIAEVGLKNYQAHSNTVINFINGDNAIIGASDSGKTALKRAIECVLYNDHSGVDYIKEGEDAFSVYVLFSDGTKIIRERGKKKLNRYIIEKNGEQLVLENFGKNVPEEVTAAHKMFKVKIGKKMDSLFSARQLDGPFFLQNTPEERGAIISSIAKTEVIDEAVNMTLSSLRDQKKEKKALEKSLKEDENTLKEYSYLDECERLLKTIQQDFSTIKELNSKLIINKNNLDSLSKAKLKQNKQEAILEIFTNIELNIKEFEIISSKSKEVSKLKNDFNKLVYLIDRQSSLNNITFCLSNIENDLDFYSKLEDKMKKITTLSSLFYQLKQDKQNYDTNKQKQKDLANIDEVVNNIDDLLIPKIKEYDKFVHLYKEYKELRKRRENGVAFISNKNKQINQKVEEYEEGLLSLGKCPTCFNDISVEKVKEGLMN